MKIPFMKKRTLERSIEKTLEKVKIETYLEYGKILRIASPLPPNIEILDKYQAGYNRMATVTIYQDLDTDIYVYHIEEPPYPPIVENLYKQVRERFQSMEMEIPEKLTERELIYEKYIQEALRELGYEEAYVKYPELRYYIIRDVVGWRIIDVPMRDPRVEEIDYSNLSGTLSVVIKHDKVAATWVDTNITLSEDDLNKLLEFMAFRTGKPVSVAQPVLEARTPEGYRLAANLKEVGLNPAFTIRKFPEIPLSLTKLVANKTMSSLIAAYLWTLVEHQKFILVIGPMASGKTTVLQALTSVIPRDKKVTCVAPGTRIATNTPRIIDTLFTGEPEIRENIESVTSNIPVLGYKGNKVFWTETHKVHKIHIPRDVKLVKIVTEFGAEVTVTPNTKIPVLTENGIVYKSASEIREGDVVPQLARYEPLEVREPDVANILDSYGFRVYLSKPIKDKKSRVVKTLRIKDYLAKKDELPEPLGLYLKGGRYVLKVPFDKLPEPKVSYLAGYLLGNGTISSNDKRPYFTVYNEEIRQKIIAIIEKLGVNYNIVDSIKTVEVTHILGHYLHALYEIPIGKKAKKIRIPSWMFIAPEEHVKAFIAGLIDSDGFVTENYLGFCSSSKEIVEDLAVLALRLGVVGKVYERNHLYYIRFEGEHAVKIIENIKKYSTKAENFKGYKYFRKTSTRLVPSTVLAYLLNIAKKKSRRLEYLAGIKEYSKKKRHHISLRELNEIAEKLCIKNEVSNILSNMFIWVYVKKVEFVNHNGIVYDITPKNAHYFFAGNGGFIVVEDTIEDTPELRLAHPRWQALYTRRSTYGTEQDVTLFDLARYSLRTRAQYIIIGEVRDREIQTLVQMAASVSRDTPVLVRIDGEVRLAKIGDIIDEEYGDAPDWSKIVPKRRIEVLTLTRDGKVEFKPVQWVLRHRVNEIYRVRYVGGEIKATGSHSVFVLNEDTLDIEVKRVDELKPGDILISFVKKTPLVAEFVFGKLGGNNNKTSEWTAYKMAWFVRLMGYISTIRAESKGNEVEYVVSVRPSSTISEDREFGKLIPMKPLRMLAHMLKPAPAGDEGVILNAVIELLNDNSTRLVHVNIANNILEYILRYRTKAISEKAEKLIDKIRWFIDSEIEVTVVKEVEKVPYNGYVYDFSVPDTEAFFGGTTPVLLHNSGHGSLCLKGIERVRVKINGIETSIPIKDLVEGILSGKLKDVKVLSINLENMKLEWKPIVRVYKVPTTEWVVIKTDSGVTTHATPDHRFPLEDGRILRAENLRVGDNLLLYSNKGISSDKIIYITRKYLLAKEWSYDIEVADNHTFLVNDKVFSMNCTFHAEDPETLFLRMTSPPLNVQPSFILTIAAVVLQTRVWSRKYQKFIRRTGKIWEITGIKQVVKEGEIPVIYKPVFIWDPVEDYHYPDDPVDLLKESKQLKIIGISTYGEEYWFDMMLWELEEKKKFIEELVNEGVFDFKEVTERIYRKSIEFKRKRK